MIRALFFGAYVDRSANTAYIVNSTGPREPILEGETEMEDPNTKYQATQVKQLKTPAEGCVITQALGLTQKHGNPEAQLYDARENRCKT